MVGNRQEGNKERLKIDRNRMKKSEKIMNNTGQYDKNNLLWKV